MIAHDEATELFAQERGEGLAALLGKLSQTQTVFDEAAYPFVYFLHRNGRLITADGMPIINDIA